MSAVLMPGRPARVLLSTDAVGGVWSYTIDLARGLADRGIEPVMAVLGPPPTEDKVQQAKEIFGLRMVATGLPLDWTARTPDEILCAAAELAAIARETRADSVHLHTPSLARGEMYGVPVVAVAHSCVATWWRAVRQGPLPADFQWRARIMQAGLAEADAVIAPSQSFADALAQVYGQRRDIFVVHNGRHTEARAGEARQSAVITAGRLWDEGKNVALLDRAASQMNVPVFAAGPIAGPQAESVHFRNLHLLGELSEAGLRQRLSSVRVFASPALYEPFGLSVLEAAQAGVALVLSDIPTFRELWDEAALFIDPHETESWARSLQRVATDPEAAATWGERARVRSARYTVEAMVERTLAIHHSVLCAPATAA